MQGNSFNVQVTGINGSPALQMYPEKNPRSTGETTGRINYEKSSTHMSRHPTGGTDQTLLGFFCCERHNALTAGSLMSRASQIILYVM